MRDEYATKASYWPQPRFYAPFLGNMQRYGATETSYWSQPRIERLSHLNSHHGRQPVSPANGQGKLLPRGFFRRSTAGLRPPFRHGSPSAGSAPLPGSGTRTKGRHGENFLSQNSLFFRILFHREDTVQDRGITRPRAPNDRRMIRGKYKTLTRDSSSRADGFPSVLFNDGGPTDQESRIVLRHLASLGFPTPLRDSLLVDNVPAHLPLCRVEGEDLQCRPGDVDLDLFHGRPPPGRSVR
ncbi:unnamed protein product [Lasius platythorax]|uniref:Uncharacterized protein n=1 Tax=Lasius platythorax TaxID=488582 RepID=A0AAV2MVZ9_9HYME